MRSHRLLLSLVCLMFCLFLPFSCLGEGRRVFMRGEAPDFAPEEELLEVYVCPLLGADAMVLTCGGQVMLVDVGRQQHNREILEILNRLNVRHVDAVINTHPHDDHLGSMINLLKDDVTIGKFYTAFDEDFKGYLVVQRSSVKALKAAGVPIERVKDGDVLPFGGATVTCMQHIFKPKQVNDSSCAQLVRFGDCTLLLTADLESTGQRALVEDHAPGAIKADIMKIPHHGVVFLEDEFMDAVSPEFAFITHGWADSKKAKKVLDKRGIPYKFATWGVIHLSTNGEYWLVDHELTEDGLRYQKKYGH